MTQVPEVLSLSVIVPLYNGARYIEQTLTSIALQTLVATGEVDLEVIVVDDGSTDDGPQLAAEHPLRPLVVHQSNHGVAAARNRGASMARGEWLAFLDQDDLWHAARLQAIAPVLRSQRASFVLTSERFFGLEDERTQIRQQEPGLAGGDMRWVARGTEVDALCRTDITAGSTPAADRFFDVSDLMRETIAMTTSFFITAVHLRLVGGWSLHAKSVDDWWLMANAARIEPILKVDQPTLLYRLHLGRV